MNHRRKTLLLTSLQSGPPSGYGFCIAVYRQGHPITLVLRYRLSRSRVGAIHWLHSDLGIVARRGNTGFTAVGGHWKHGRYGSGRDQPAYRELRVGLDG